MRIIFRQLREQYHLRFLSDFQNSIDNIQVRTLEELVQLSPNFNQLSESTLDRFLLYCKSMEKQSDENSLQHIWHTCCFYALKDFENVEISKDYYFIKSTNKMDHVDKQIFANTAIFQLRFRKKRSIQLLLTVQRDEDDSGSLAQMRNAILLKKYMNHKKKIGDIFGLAANQSQCHFMKYNTKNPLQQSNGIQIFNKNSIDQNNILYVMNYIRQICMKI